VSERLATKVEEENVAMAGFAQSPYPQSDFINDLASFRQPTGQLAALWTPSTFD